MTQAVLKFFTNIKLAINNVRYNNVNARKRPFNYYNNATLYYKTRFIPAESKTKYISGFWLEEIPVRMLPSWNPYYNNQLPDRLDEDADIILPIYLYNDKNSELDSREFVTVKTISSFLNQFKNHISYCVASVICDSVRYCGDSTIIFDIDNKKLLFLVTTSNNENFSSPKTIHFYFDESIFRTNTVVNKFLRSAYAELFSSYVQSNIFDDATLLPEICMGIPNICYKEDFKNIGDGTFESQKEYIQGKIDSFINSYEQQKN